MDKRNELISEGIRKGFAEGKSKMANRICNGYEQDEHGNLVINEQEAKIVHCIFDLYISGYTLGKIADSLFERGIESPMGKLKWNREAIDKLLSNEKHIGDVLLQKTFISNGRQVDNKNTFKQYISHDNHPSIISKELFDEVQAEKLHRSNTTRNQTGFERKATRYNSGYVLSGFIVCSEMRRSIPPDYTTQ
ncbi:MAG: recombinase family protein [Bacillota bacterium]